MKRTLQVGVQALVVGLLIGAVSAQDAKSLETLKNQADEAYRKRDFPTALKLVEQVLAQSPQDHVALYLRGSSRVEMGIVSGDLDLIRKGIEDARQSIGAEGTGKPEYYLPYIYGMTHLAALEGKPTHAQTALTVANSLLEREDLQPEQKANLLYQRAQAHLQLKQTAEGEADLQESLKLSPRHLAALMLLADVSAKTKSPEAALAIYTQVVQAFPENPITYNNRGRFLQSQGRTSEAVTDFNKAIQIDPKFVPGYINRGFAYLDSGDAASAEAAFTEALKIDPQQTQAFSLRGTARLNQNKASEALADYRKVVELAPQNPMAFADLGFAQFFTGDFKGALQSFSSALQIDGKLRFLLPWKLACEIRVNELDQKPYEASLAKPEGSRDWVDSLILFQLGRIDYKQLLQSVHPTDENARNAQLCEGYYYIGMELQRRGRANDAVGYWQQAAQRKLNTLAAYRGAVFALRNAEKSTQ